MNIQDSSGFLATFTLDGHRTVSSGKCSFADNLIKDGNDSSECRGSGRKPNMFDSITVFYKERNYIVFTLQYKAGVKHYVCDSADLPMIQDKNWHISSGKYIGKNFMLPDGKIKEVYIHNFLMNNMNNDATEEKKYVIHINRNAFDNRRANLKLVTESELHKYKSKKKRTIQLPNNSNITVEDIPMYVSYIKPTGNHSDRFSIEIPQLNIFWKSSSSKKLTLQDKFNETLERLAELKVLYPDCFIHDDVSVSKTLLAEFEEILKLAGVQPIA